MRNSLLLVCFLWGMLSYAQPSFPGVDIDYFIGKTLKLKETNFTTEPGRYDRFFKTEKLKFSDRKLLKIKKYLGTEFELVNVINDTYYKGRRALELKNDDLGTLYYEYDVENVRNFDFEVVGGVNFPEGYFCKDIDPVRHTSSGALFSDAVYFSKSSTGGIYISLEAHDGGSPDVNKKGVVIKLENGATVENHDAVIDVDVIKSSRFPYRYTVMFKLTEEQINLLTKYKMMEYTLYFHNRVVSNFDENWYLREYIRCLAKDE